MTIGRQHDEGKLETKRKDRTSESEVMGHSIGEERKWGHRGSVTRMKTHKKGVHRGVSGPY